MLYIILYIIDIYTNDGIRQELYPALHPRSLPVEFHVWRPARMWIFEEGAKLLGYAYDIALIVQQVSTPLDEIVGNDT